MPWYTYIVECSDGSYYVGITNDVSSRIEGRRPVSPDDEV
jgi:predicted GIY-YIG superfamily endonuclease